MGLCDGEFPTFCANESEKSNAHAPNRIEVEPRQVYWSDSGELVALACEDTFYVLRYSRENYIEAAQAGQVDEDGVESAFEVITDIAER